MKMGAARIHMLPICREYFNIEVKQSHLMAALSIFYINRLAATVRYGCILFLQVVYESYVENW